MKLLQTIGTTLNLKPILQHNLSAQQELNVPIFDKTIPIPDTQSPITFLTHPRSHHHQQADYFH